MRYEPYVFTVYIAASTHNMDPWIKAVEDAVDEYNSSHEIYRFNAVGCHNASNAFNFGKMAFQQDRPPLPVWTEKSSKDFFQ